MCETVLYIGSLVDDTISDVYDIGDHSIAGNNKTKNVIRSLQTEETNIVVLSPLFLNKTDLIYRSGRSVHNDDLDVDVYVPPHVGVFGLNYLTVVLASTLYALMLSLQVKPDMTIFYNYRLQRMLPAVIGSLGSTLVLQYEDARLELQRRNRISGAESLHIRILRGIEKATKPLIDRRVEGAICTNTNLAEIAPTDNTAIVRGVPSVGHPDEMPDESLEDDSVVVMFASKLDRERGIDRFLEAAEQIERSDVEFWISGYGSGVKRVRSRVDRLDDDRVRFFGTLPWDEYRQRLVDADVLVNLQNPDNPESEYVFPSKLLDFMSARAVILSTDMSDIKTCLDEEVLVADVGDEVDALERVIEAIAADPEHYSDRVTAAERWVESQTRETTADRIRTVYEGANA